MATERQDDVPLARSPAAETPQLGPQVQDLAVTVSVELGRAWRTLEELLAMGEQSLIELDRAVGAPTEVYVNGRLFARGDVVTVSANFGVRITEIVRAEDEAP